MVQTEPRRAGPGRAGQRRAIKHNFGYRAGARFVLVFSLGGTGLLPKYGSFSNIRVVPGKKNQDLKHTHNSNKKTEPSRARPGRAQPGRAKPSQDEPGRTEPSQAGTVQAKPGPTDPSRVKPSQSEPRRAGTSRAEPRSAERREPNGAWPIAAPSRPGSSTAKPGRGVKCISLGVTGLLSVNISPCVVMDSF